MTPHPPPPEGFETWLGYVIATCPRPDALTYAHSELWHARSELARLRRIEKAARDVAIGWGPGIRAQDDYHVAFDALRRELDIK